MLDCPGPMVRGIFVGHALDAGPALMLGLPGMTDTPHDTSQSVRRPRAFRLEPLGAGGQGDAPGQRPRAAEVTIEAQADAYAGEAAAILEADAAMNGDLMPGSARQDGLIFGLSWSGLFWSALGGLASLAFSLWVTRLIGDLFAYAVALGWLGVGLAALAVLSLLVLAAREVQAVLRQGRIAHLHAALGAAHATDDTPNARALLGDLLKLYAARPQMARPRAALAGHMQAIIDGRDLINIAERDLVAPLDLAAQREIAAASKRVSAFTAISPRALLDVLFVLAQAIRLLRRIAEIYGGRPGFFGFFRLARSVGAHLAITGGMAVGDSLVQQLVGHGIAAKLSARLGEGVLNGLLTARVGLAAMAVCRPMPFNAVKAPRVRDIAPFLFGANFG